MAINVASPDVKSVALTTFSGCVTNINPVALPQGSSPDCSDCSFLPSGVFSRACFQKVFATPLGAVTVAYAKTYLDNTGIIRNFYLDSVGNFWMEIVAPSNLAVAPTVILKTTPGSSARSVTANGREYVAIHNGIQGSDIPYQITGLPDGTVQIDRVTQDGPGSPPTVANYVIPASNIGSITRAANIVTVVTLSAHGLNIGYQAQIAGTLALQVGGGIVSITINNESNPGIATVETNTAHGLVPQNQVSLTGINSSPLGNIGSISRQGQVVTVIMQITTTFSSVTGSFVISPNTDILTGGTSGATAYLVALAGANAAFLPVEGTFIAGETVTQAGSGATAVITLPVFPPAVAPGTIITLTGVSDTSFNTTVTIASVINPVAFTFDQVDVNKVVLASGIVQSDWPIAFSDETTLFSVESAPTATTFQVQLNYSDGTWTGGVVSLPWDGTFYVLTVPSATQFTYTQYGSNGTGGAVGTVTPYGQITPGLHQVQQFFIDRQGGVTTPSPPVNFEANGGQYVQITNMAIGPSPHIIARGFAFTGAERAYFFYIPSPPQVNGQIVGTATQINDNTTTSAIFDFGDPTLFAALGISIPGNNLANQVVINGALWFGYYGSRLLTAGQRNAVGNLLNMGFDGGYLPSATSLPTGWSGGGAGSLVAGHYGGGWQTSSTPLTQSMYEDYSGAPIAGANDLYSFSAWLSIAGSVTATISSVSASFSSTATISANGAGFAQANFSMAMPNVIPSDLILGITGTNSVVVDEMSIIDSQNPVATGCLGSYVNNPEGFDGVTGVFAPNDDTHQVMGVFIIRSSLYMLTLDPNGRLHETSQGNTEPAEWVIGEVASNCGLVGVAALTQSQADDSTASGGEEWAAWYSFDGPRIFGGSTPDKIAQEIQPPSGAGISWRSAGSGRVQCCGPAHGLGVERPAIKDPVLRHSDRRGNRSVCYLANELCRDGLSRADSQQPARTPGTFGKTGNLRSRPQMVAVAKNNERRRADVQRPRGSASCISRWRRKYNGAALRDVRHNVPGLAWNIGYVPDR